MDSFPQLTALIVYPKLPPESAEAATLKVGGRTVIERQLHQLARMGVKKVLILHPPPGVPPEHRTVSVELLEDATRLANLSHCLVLEGDTVIDDRIIRSIAGHPAKIAVATQRPDAPGVGPPHFV